MKPSKVAILFGLGAVLGTGGDLFHVFSGTLEYPPNQPFGPWGSPVWVPLLFGTSTALLGTGHPGTDARFGGTRAKPGVCCPSACAAGLVWFLCVYAASGYLPLATGGGKDAVIAAMALATWAALDRSRAGLLQAALTAAGGVLTEILLVRLGVFRYLPASANFFGVPTWLPFLYVSASVTVGNLGRLLSAPA